MNRSNHVRVVTLLAGLVVACAVGGASDDGELVLSDSVEVAREIAAVDTDATPPIDAPEPVPDGRHTEGVDISEPGEAVDASEAVDVVETARGDESGAAEPVEAGSEVQETAVDVAEIGPAPVGCVTSIEPGHHVFPCQGLDFDVTVPEACLDAPCGLVIDIHGLTMDAQQQDNNTDLRKLGADYGFIVVQPNAEGSPPLSKWTTFEDDDKVMAFAKDAFAAWRTDPSRFHVTGFSQGGFMTWRLLCQHSHLIASVAAAGSCAAYGIEIPYLGSLSEVGCAFTGTDKPAKEVPVLQMHGTLDPIIPYLCGYNLHNAVIAAWNLTETEAVSSDDDHSWKRYLSPSGNVYEFISHDYRSKSLVLQGHCLPGSKDLDGGEPGQLLGGFGCKDQSPFVWGEAVMKFFVAHPMAVGVEP